MTPRKLLLAHALGLVCAVGCTASHTQLTSQIHQPLPSQATLGDVAVVSVDRSRSQHRQRAADVRKSLQESLRKDGAVREVVDSLELPPVYGADRKNVDTATLLRQACDRLRGKPVDTICLVQLRDATDELTLGLGIPPERLVSVRGKCEYQLQLFDVRTGRELFCSTGTWSERTDAPAWPRMPSASHFGQQVAQVISPATPSTVSPKLVAAATRN